MNNESLSIVDYGDLLIDLANINIATLSVADVDFEIVVMDKPDIEPKIVHNVEDIETAESTAGLLFGKVNVSLAATDMTQIAVVDD